MLAAGLLTQPSYLVTTVLPVDQTLHVRVGSRVGGVWRYGNSIPFMVLRTTATMLYPTANATGVSTTQAFQWTSVSGADAYILHIGTAPDTWNVLAAGLLTQTSYLVTTTLPTGVPLYVRVGSRTAGMWRYSASISFTAAATTATMIYPTANATDVSTAQAFQWTAVTGADAYILHIGTAPDTWNVLAAGLLSQPSYVVATTLPTGVTLYVRVGSRVGGIWRYSASIPFTAALMTATMTYPTANATGVSTAQPFQWTSVSGADAYILHIGTAPDTWNVLAAGLLDAAVVPGHHDVADRCHALRAGRIAGRRNLALLGEHSVHRAADDGDDALSDRQCHRSRDHRRRSSGRRCRAPTRTSCTSARRRIPGMCWRRDC